MRKGHIAFQVVTFRLGSLTLLGHSRLFFLTLKSEFQVPTTNGTQHKPIFKIQARGKLIMEKSNEANPLTTDKLRVSQKKLKDIRFQITAN